MKTVDFCSLFSFAKQTCELLLRTIWKFSLSASIKSSKSTTSPLFRIAQSTIALFAYPRRCLFELLPLEEAFVVVVVVIIAFATAL